MRVGILGAGAIGSLVGAFVKQAGFDVVLVDPYDAHMKKIREEGLVIDSADGLIDTVKMETYTKAEDACVVDILIVLVKTYMTEEALKGASAMIGDETLICTLQNGLGTELKLLEMFPKERVFYGVLKFNSRITEPGKLFVDIRKRPGHRFTIGAADTGSKYADKVKALCEGLEASGSTAAFVDNIEYYIWSKAINNVACNALCGILRLTGGQMYDNENSRRVLEKIIREIFDVAKAKGIDLGNVDEILAKYPEYPINNIRLHYPSTAQDMIGKKKTEINFLNGAISYYGKQLGVPTPVNDTISDLVRAIEENYENQAFEQ